MPDVAAARAGRRAVAEVLQSWNLPAYAVDDTVLLVSELVSNAVVHARQATPLEMELVLADARLRVSLSDSSPIAPSPRHAARADEGGRGMAIIDALSDGWGVEGHAGGKRVWFEVDLTRMAPTAAEQAGDDAWDDASQAAARPTRRQDA